VDGRVAPVAAGHLGVPHQAVPVEDADRLGGDVEARSGPGTDDVGLLDLDHADVLELLGSDHLEDGPGVGPGQRPLGEALGQAPGRGVEACGVHGRH
jgi:hypothetical protein